jgi:predicted nuclease of predicted toxin-antitoxin system
MLKFAADEDFKGAILRGLRRRLAGLDVVRVQDVGLAATPDPAILEWAAQEGRLVLTHDASTMTHFAYERVRAGKPMPGVVVIKRPTVTVGQAIAELEVLIQCSFEGEWEGQILYLPL